MESQQRIDVQHGFAGVHHLIDGEQLTTEAEHVMLVWHETQILPAEQYRKAHYSDESTDIAICDDPNVYLPMIGRRGLIYHFTGSGSGGGR